MLFHFVVDVVGGAGFSDVSQGFGPGEGGFFPVGEERRFAEGGEAIEALLGFAEMARFAGVHVQTEGAAVDLGNAQFDKRPKFGFDQLGQVLMDAEENLIGVGGHGAIGDAG